MGRIIYFLQRYYPIPSRSPVNGTGFFKDASREYWISAIRSSTALEAVKMFAGISFIPYYTRVSSGIPLCRQATSLYRTG